MATLMSVINILAMVLATIRLTEFFTQDRIMEPLRKRFAFYPWACYRCVSVWAGILTMAIFFWFPVANLPLALSWIYIASIDWSISRRPRQILIEVDNKTGAIQLRRSDFGPLEVLNILNQVVASSASSLLPPAPQIRDVSKR
jgi:hypothetical protein